MGWANPEPVRTSPRVVAGQAGGAATTASLQRGNPVVDIINAGLNVVEVGRRQGGGSVYPRMRRVDHSEPLTKPLRTCGGCRTWPSWNRHPPGTQSCTGSTPLD